MTTTGTTAPLKAQVLDQETAATIRAWSLADTELAHSEADKILCDLLERMGFTETVAAFRKMEKWYA